MNQQHVQQDLRAKRMEEESMAGGKVLIGLTGRSKGPDKGITDEVFDLAEQLG